MKSVQKIDLGMTGLDDLFMTDQQRAEKKLPKIEDISLDLIDDFPGHPFKVRLDEDMEQLVESIKERGLITPIILRTKEDGRYEIVSGHRRRKACELAGIHTVKAEVREMTRDEAIILMVDANLQRSEILPSEKAFAYKMRLEAMKRLPGRPSKENGAPVEHHLQGQKSRDILASEVGESKDQVRRFIRLTELVPDILDKVDEGKIGLRPAVELSYLAKNEQNMIADAMEYTDSTPSHAQAIRFRDHSKKGTLTAKVIKEIMNEEKPNQMQRISVRLSDARKYIPSDVPLSKTGEYLLKALEYYHDYLLQQKSERPLR